MKRHPLANVVLILILAHMLTLHEERWFIAVLLVQCYCTNTQYDKMDWKDYNSVVNFFQDVSLCLIALITN